MEFHDENADANESRVSAYYACTIALLTVMYSRSMYSRPECFALILACTNCDNHIYITCTFNCHTSVPRSSSVNGTLSCTCSCMC